MFEPRSEGTGIRANTNWEILYSRPTRTKSHHTETKSPRAQDEWKENETTKQANKK